MWQLKKNLPVDTYCHFNDIEFRRTKSVGSNLDTLEGLAVPYEQYSQLLYGFMYEILRSNSFTECLSQNPDIRGYVDHDTGKILGRTKSKTLTLTETKRGVEFSMVIPDTSYGIDLLKNVDRGDIDGMSFGFRADTYDWGMYNGEELRDIKKATLREISVVSSPAYLQTEVYMRSMEEVYKELKEHKQLLQENIRNQNDLLRRRLDLFARE